MDYSKPVVPEANEYMLKNRNITSAMCIFLTVPKWCSGFKKFVVHSERMWLKQSFYSITLIKSP